MNIAAMNVTKFLLMCVIIAGIANIVTQEEGKVSLLSYIAMWVIAILQIIGRILGA